MTSKERVYAAMEGRAVDRYPVAALYFGLYAMDHFEELTGEPQWKVHSLSQLSVDDHMALYRKIIDRAPFEMLQPFGAPPPEDRGRQEFVEKDGKHFRHDTLTDEWEEIGTTISGHATDYKASETQSVFDRNDVDEQIIVIKAVDRPDRGGYDYVKATVAEFGNEHFIICGGLTGTVWSAGGYLGQTNLYRMMAEKPDLVDYLCERILERDIETIREHASAGGDAIWIDDATATCDVISVKHYERFSLPYIKAMVDETHAAGLKAILVYFGGVADRLEQIASTGADALQMETSMKGYVNDIERAARAIGDRMTLFANIDPIGILQDATDERMEAEIRRQVAAGQHARGFILAPASPITPFTPLARVRKFIELCHEIGRPAE